MKTVIALGLLLLISGSVFASDDTIWKQDVGGGTTYYTDQDGRSAVSQTVGGQTTLYDNGSGLVDSGKVTLGE